jgi:hypothetical protein
MVVDDNWDLAELYQLFLTQCGARVIVTHTMRDCVGLFQLGVRIDGLISDHHLPDGWGGDLPSLLGPLFPRISFLVTGYCEDLQARYPGFLYYMRKPIILEVFLGTIMQHIGEHNERI